MPTMPSSFDLLFEEPVRPVEAPLQLAGETVGPYRLVRRLVDGPLSQVYEAHDPTLARRAAVKVLKPGPWLTGAVRMRFETEGRILAQLRHPHVISLYGVHQIGELPCLAMEYAGGGTLFDRIGNRRVDPQDAARVVLRIATGLAAAHRLGIVHRDLKPQNVLLDDAVHYPDLSTCFGFIKLTDFGIAKVVDDFESRTLTGHLQPGTPLYMAPEQVEGRKEAIGPRTDVHALGLLAFVLLTGRHPYTAATMPATLHRILCDQPRAPRSQAPGIPEWLNAACLKCLAKDPAERFGDADELAEVFSRNLGPARLNPHRKPMAPAIRGERPPAFRDWARVGLLVVTFLIVFALVSKLLT